MMSDLAQQRNWILTATENSELFTKDFLKIFDVAVFLNTTGDVLNEQQQKAFEEFMNTGKGFVGIHSASDTEYEWDWYTKLVGRMFHIHPAIQTAKVNIVDSTFPGLQGFVSNKLWTDEWYEFGPEKVTDLHYALSIDETSYNPTVEWGNRKVKIINPKNIKIQEVFLY